MNKIVTKKRVVRIAIIAGVVILPLLYSFLYLGAFWDPYSTLDTLPVAIVNNDAGAVINDEQRNIGSEMCDELLKDGSLKFIVTDAADAKAGTEGKEYYAMIVVPSDFSADIASSAKADKQKATITFSSNEKRNYLATQILSKATLEIEKNLRSKVNKEITSELSAKLKEIPGQLSELQNGLGQLNDGSKQLTDGTGKLSDGSQELAKGAADLANGTNEFSNKFDEYQAGVDTAVSGAGSVSAGAGSVSAGADGISTNLNSLSTGAGSLNTGIDQLLTGATALETGTQSLTDLQNGANQLAAGAGAFNTNLIAYTSGVDSLIQNVKNTTAFLTQYVSKNPTIMSDPEFAGFITSMSNPTSQQNIKTLSEATAGLKTASATIAGGISQLASSTNDLTKIQAAVSQIKQGLEQAKDGSTKVADGSSKLATGAAQLSSGASKLADGANSLNSGMSKLSTATGQLDSAANDIAGGAAKVSSGANAVNGGVSDINDGAQKLKDGIATAKDGVDTSVTDANEQVGNLNGLDEFASDPVSIESDRINPVPNYGTAFAPYFLSLSLWVGAIIIFVGIYLDSENKFKMLSRDCENKTLRTFAYLLIGFVQAVFLAVVLKICLGLHVNHMGMYFASCCLVSMVFLSIVQFLMVFLKDIGKFLSLVLLILQLTSCGGTFPMETVPKFFNWIYPFMPMTYSVSLFKESISGGDAGNVWFNVIVLVSILLVFTLMTVAFSRVKKSKAVILNNKALA